MWDLPKPGIEPMSPALQGALLITGPPGKSSNSSFLATPYGRWDPVPRPVIEHVPLTLGAWNFDQWSIREVPLVS